MKTLIRRPRSMCLSPRLMSCQGIEHQKNFAFNTAQSNNDSTCQTLTAGFSSLKRICNFVLQNWIANPVSQKSVRGKERQDLHYHFAMKRHKIENSIIGRHSLATLKQSQCIEPHDKIYPLLDLAINAEEAPPTSPFPCQCMGCCANQRRLLRIR